ncbi:hypothetical protein GCM10022215_29480 [Nocardioides fonticola]|uniref:IrrE N-terminal-like domain-containing protein n=1 Tax=Nocardioides fonticola TaxID=450363 RepID=A0ABP7XP66_9ACTN
MLVKDKARAHAARVLQQTWSAGFPVDPERIASQMPNMEVQRLPLEKGISGMLRVEPDYAIIYVNSADSPERQRFTIAHELGHYIERTDRGQDDFNVIDYRSDKQPYDLHEFYADEFAGHLLMPTEEFLRMVHRGDPVALVAKYFGVSVPAVRQRYQRIRMMAEAEPPPPPE